MKTITLKITCFCLFVFSLTNLCGQDIRISKTDLVYSIPLLAKSSKGHQAVHKWLENNKGNEIYNANYQYDGMQRIKQLDEIASGITIQLIYQYNPRGQLEKVIRNGVVSEQYAYDNFGNRTAANLNNTNYNYQNNNLNQANKYSWTQSVSTKHREFNYNNAGQLTGTVNKTGNTVTSSKNFLTTMGGK
jgi:YD repeat-containing protein